MIQIVFLFQILAELRFQFIYFHDGADIGYHILLILAQRDLVIVDLTCLHAHILQETHVVYHSSTFSRTLISSFKLVRLNGLKLDDIFDFLREFYCWNRHTAT